MRRRDEHPGERLRAAPAPRRLRGPGDEAAPGGHRPCRATSPGRWWRVTVWWHVVGSVQRNGRRERSRHGGDGAILGRWAAPPVLRCRPSHGEQAPGGAEAEPAAGTGAARPPGTLRSLIKSRGGGGEPGGWPRGRGRRPPGTRRCRRRAPLRALLGEERKGKRTVLGPVLRDVRTRAEPTSPWSLQVPFTSHPEAAWGVVFTLGRAVDLSITWRALSVLRRR